MEYIQVTKEELDQFKYTFRKDIKLYQFWKDIVMSMPENLKLEVRSKPSQLEYSLVHKVKDGRTPYRFVTRNASVELQDYLNQFVVYLNSTLIHSQRSN